MDEKHATSMNGSYHSLFNSKACMRNLLLIALILVKKLGEKLRTLFLSGALAVTYKKWPNG